MTVEITYERALSLVNDEIKKMGHDYVYPTNARGGCDYIRNGEASCLVGRVLFGAGVDLFAVPEDTLKRHADDLFRRLDSTGALRIDDEAWSLLASLQAYQDQGVPWGHALMRVLDGNKWHNDYYGDDESIYDRI